MYTLFFSTHLKLVCLLKDAAYCVSVGYLKGEGGHGKYSFPFLLEIHLF